MDQRRVIAAGALALVAAAIVIGAIFYFVSVLTRGSDQSNLSNLPVVAITTTPSPGASALTPVFSGSSSSTNPTGTPVDTNQDQTGSSNTSVSSDFKTYSGDNFMVSYPKNWGLLTCSNSVNFEFDPASSQDQSISCDYAVKPVTVLVRSLGSVSCPGNVVTIGSFRVIKSTKTYSSGGIDYRWCFDLGNHTFDLTHRYDPNGGRATSTTDYSSQIEQDLISNFKSNSTPS